MKKYISIFVASLIVLAFILLSLRNDTSKNKGNTDVISKSPAGTISKIDKNIPSSYSGESLKFTNNELGISFIYPAKWGNPTFSHQNPGFGDGDLKLTSIFTIDQGILILNFEYYPITLTFFDNNYLGQKYPNAFYSDSDPKSYYDNIPVLIDTKDVCKYKHNFEGFTNNDEKSSTIQEVFSECDNNINYSFIKNSQYFSANDLWGDAHYKYRYNIELNSFIKLKNTRFPYLLIKYNGDMTEQLDDQDLDIKIYEQKYLDESIDRVSSKFSDFVGSIKTFDGEIKSIEKFQAIKGESAEITLIRKYYYYIENGKFEQAYDMLDKESFSLEEYEQMYLDLFLIKASNFQQLKNNEYKFDLVVQNHNSDPQDYEVIIKVENGKLQELSSIIVYEIAKYSDDLIARIEGYGIEQTLMIYKDGESIELFTFNVDTGGSQNGVNVYGAYANLHFTKDGKYLMFEIIGMEWLGSYVYDLEKNDIIHYNDNSTFYGFTKDDQYYYAVACNPMDGTQYANIYDVSKIVEQQDCESNVYNPCKGFDLLRNFDEQESISCCQVVYNSGDNLLEFSSPCDFGAEQKGNYVYDFQNLELKTVDSLEN